jgi:hypothetical protein
MGLLGKDSAHFAHSGPFFPPPVKIFLFVPSCPSLPVFLSWKDTPVGLRAAVERGPSQGARSASRRTTRSPSLCRRTSVSILLGGKWEGWDRREQRDRHRQRQRSQSLLSFNYPALTAFFRALNNCSWLIGFGRNSTPAALNMLEAFSSFGDPLSTMIGQVGYWER